MDIDPDVTACICDWVDAAERDTEERSVKAVWDAQVSVQMDKNTTERDIQAMEYAVWQLKHTIVAAIKGENK